MLWINCLLSCVFPSVAQQYEKYAKNVTARRLENGSGVFLTRDQRVLDSIAVFYISLNTLPKNNGKSEHICECSRFIYFQLSLHISLYISSKHSNKIHSKRKANTHTKQEIKSGHEFSASGCTVWISNIEETDWSERTIWFFFILFLFFPSMFLLLSFEIRVWCVCESKESIISSIHPIPLFFPACIYIKY